MDNQPKPQSNQTSQPSRLVSNLESMINPEIRIDLTGRGRPRRRRPAGTRFAEILNTSLNTDNDTL